MSDYGFDDGLNEAFYSDPAAVIAAASQQAAAQAVSQYAAAVHQSTAGLEQAKIVAEVEEKLREAYGSTWDRYSHEAVDLVARHNLVETPTANATAKALADVTEQLIQRDRDAEAAKQQQREDEWRKQINEANAGFSTFSS